MIKKTIYFLIVLLALISVVHANELESYNVTYKIQDDNRVNVKIIGCPDVNLKVTIPEKSKNIKQVISNCTIVEYWSDALIERSGSRRVFLSDVKMPMYTEELNTKVFLPKGASIAEPLIEESSITDSIFPNPTSISSDGTHIIVIWKRENVPKGDGLPLLVIYEKKTSYMYLFYILIAVSIIIASIIVIKKRPSKEIKEVIKEKKIVVNGFHLKEDEEELVSILKKRNGECEQSTLNIISDFSKAKLSTLLKELEERKIIKRVEKGKKKVVYLKELYLNDSEQRKE